MLPIISFVGASDSGKTTFLEKLIPELAKRGYSVGAIKHDVHGFEMDREGKDTWRLKRAGANAVSISSPSGIGLVRNTGSELSVEEIAARFFWTEDILITEGFKSAHFPKIEVFRPDVEPALICGPKDNLAAVIADGPVDAGVPVFTFSDLSGVADFIETRWLKNRKKPSILVQVDGKQLPMNDFVQEFLTGGILGMLSTLRGWKKPSTLSIHIRVEGDDQA